MFNIIQKIKALFNRKKKDDYYIGVEETCSDFTVECIYHNDFIQDYVDLKNCYEADGVYKKHNIYSQEKTVTTIKNNEELQLHKTSKSLFNDSVDLEDFNSNYNHLRIGFMVIKISIKVSSINMTSLVNLLKELRDLKYDCNSVSKDEVDVYIYDTLDVFKKESELYTQFKEENDNPVNYYKFGFSPLYIAYINCVENQLNFKDYFKGLYIKENNIHINPYKESQVQLYSIDLSPFGRAILFIDTNDFIGINCIIGDRIKYNLLFLSQDNNRYIVSIYISDIDFAYEGNDEISNSIVKLVSNAMRKSGKVTIKQKKKPFEDDTVDEILE